MAIHADGIFLGWLPADYLDEAVPGCRGYPDDWLVHGDVIRLASASSEDDGDDGSGAVVACGDTVSFYGNTTFGRVTVTLRSSFPLAYDVEGDVSKNATVFWIPFDSDTICQGPLKAFVEMGALEGWLVIGEAAEVGSYDWTDRAFRLVDGAFVAVPS